MFREGILPPSTVLKQIV